MWGKKRWNCQVIRPANCHRIPSNRFLDGFPDPSQFAATNLTYYSTMPHRPSDSSRAICAIVVLVGFIRSVLVFKTQQSTVELGTGHVALAVPHPLHQYRNRFNHQLQLKLPMGIPSPFCNLMQMASATNRLN